MKARSATSLVASISHHCPVKFLLHNPNDHVLTLPKHLLSYLAAFFLRFLQATASTLLGNRVPCPSGSLHKWFQVFLWPRTHYRKGGELNLCPDSHFEEVAVSATHAGLSRFCLDQARKGLLLCHQIHSGQPLR